MQSLPIIIFWYSHVMNSSSFIQSSKHAVFAPWSASEDVSPCWNFRNCCRSCLCPFVLKTFHSLLKGLQRRFIHVPNWGIIDTFVKVSFSAAHGDRRNALMNHCRYHRHWAKTPKTPPWTGCYNILAQSIMPKKPPSTASNKAFSYHICFFSWLPSSFSGWSHLSWSYQFNLLLFKSIEQDISTFLQQLLNSQKPISPFYRHKSNFMLRTKGHA